MTHTVVVLTEDALAPIDVKHIRELAGPGGTDVRIIVPTQVRRSVVAEFIDHLALLDLKEAWEDVTGANERTPQEARSEATEALTESVRRFTEAGITPAAAGIADDVVAGLRAELETAEGNAQVIAVTQPRAVADAFHRGWADEIEADLGVAVLHFYTGTSYLEA